MPAKIFCCCNEAAKFCADTCSRWAGVSKPEIVYNIPAWPKKAKPKKSASVQAACDYADSLDWDEPE